MWIKALISSFYPFSIVLLEILEIFVYVGIILIVFWAEEIPICFNNQKGCGCVACRYPISLLLEIHEGRVDFIRKTIKQTRAGCFRILGLTLII